MNSWLMWGIWCGTGFQPVSGPIATGKMPVPRAKSRHLPPPGQVRQMGNPVRVTQRMSIERKTTKRPDPRGFVPIALPFCSSRRGGVPMQSTRVGRESAWSPRSGLLIGCGPKVPIVVFSRRGPDQDAGAGEYEPARPEDEGIRTNDAPQGGGLDRALTLGPDPGQPGRHLEPGAGRPSARQLDCDSHRSRNDLATRPCRRTPPREDRRRPSTAAVSSHAAETHPGAAGASARAGGRPHGTDPGADGSCDRPRDGGGP